MEKEVVKFDTYKLLEDTSLGLQALITTVLAESDSRLFGVLETISQAVWRTDREIAALVEGEEVRPLTIGEMRNLLNAMQGRVLTVLEAVFESPMQCEAIKSLARQKIWRFYNSVEKRSQAYIATKEGVEKV